MGFPIIPIQVNLQTIKAQSWSLKMVQLKCQDYWKRLNIYISIY